MQVQPFKKLNELKIVNEYQFVISEYINIANSREPKFNRTIKVGIKIFDTRRTMLKLRTYRINSPPSQK